MQSVMKYSGRAELAILAFVALAIALFLLAGPAFAGADTTFDTALTKFTDFLEGSGGKIITVLSLAGGIVALASGRFSMGQIAIPVGVGVGAGAPFVPPSPGTVVPSWGTPPIPATSVINQFSSRSRVIVYGVIVFSPVGFCVLVIRVDTKT